jgi:hypothetical protein
MTKSSQRIKNFALLAFFAVQKKISAKGWLQLA